MTRHNHGVQSCDVRNFVDDTPPYIPQMAVSPRKALHSALWPEAQPAVWQVWHSC